jgi:DNA-binding IclR family transcriptional regulator
MKSLRKVFKIIELLANNKEMRLQEIADELGMYKSNAYKIASDLCEYGYLNKNDATKKYRLGFKFLNISSAVIENLDLRIVARDSIEHLNNIINETVHLAILMGNQAFYIDKVETMHSIRTFSRIGMPVAMHCTGVGKAILAFQPPETIEKILQSTIFKKYTKNTITNKKQLLEELKKISEVGYAVDNEEADNDIVCVAAPIWDSTNKVIASVSVTTIVNRFSMKDLLEYKDLVCEKAYEISKKIGYNK